MAASARVYFACVLLMAVLSISYKGVYGQNVECATKAAQCLSSLKTTGDKEDICKSVKTYFTCIENAIKECGLGEDVLTGAKEQAAQLGCSGSGLPVISMICLLVAAIFHLFI